MSEEVKKRDIIYNRISKVALKLQSVEGFKNETIGTVGARKTVLQSDWDKLTEINDHLLAVAKTDGERKAHDELYAKALNYYLIAVGDIEKYIQKHEIDLKGSNTSMFDSDGPSMGLRFAPIRLAKFDGTHSNWIAFRNQYVTLRMYGYPMPLNSLN